jgi:MarR family transcriptional regulator, organic hydroperoxide resistance regulator
MCPPSAASGRDRAQEFLPDLLARAAHAVVQGFAADLRERGASVPVWRVLAALLARPGETVSGLAEACLLQQPTMTKLLDRMVRDGLVTSAQDARDRRLIRVALTPRGERLATKLVAVAERYEAEVLARHPQAEAIKPVLQAIVARPGPPPRHARGGEDASGEEDT